MERKFNTIEEAAEALRQGQIIVVIDDPDRENEGDLICAARHATTANVNFMACYGKGLICMPMSSALTQKLGLGQMVSHNTDNHCTAFTVSIDHVSTGTGISAVCNCDEVGGAGCQAGGFPPSRTHVPFRVASGRSASAPRAH